MMLDFAIEERTQATDAYYNYCWWPYEPVADPTGKRRPVSLLLKTFQLAGCANEGEQVVGLLQRELGLFRTVYGAKWDGREWSWEFYFYDYERRERTVSISRVLNALRAWAPNNLTINENLPYFMFSLDFTPTSLRTRAAWDVVHMYLGNPGSLVSSGVSYGIRVNETRLENFYFFFRAHDQLRAAVEKVYCSPRVDARHVDVDSIFWPRLVPCDTICIANKSLADTIYFSGVRVDQLLDAVRPLEYPDEFVSHLANSVDTLDHLLFDIGFDFDSVGETVYIVKSGFYGVF